MRRKERVVVTGIGAVTALGSNVTEMWPRLAAGESGARYLGQDSLCVPLGARPDYAAFEKFGDMEDLEVGQRFRMDTPDGPAIFTVVSIGESEVRVDGNHPLAGMTLNFDITVQSVREATTEELEHGHVHE